MRVGRDCRRSHLLRPRIALLHVQCQSSRPGFGVSTRVHHHAVSPRGGSGLLRLRIAHAGTTSARDREKQKQQRRQPQIPGPAVWRPLGRTCSRYKQHSQRDGPQPGRWCGRCRPGSRAGKGRGDTRRSYYLDGEGCGRRRVECQSGGQRAGCTRGCAGARE